MGSLDAASPTDSALLSTLYGIVRETRAQVNTNEDAIAALGGGGIAFSEVTINGQTTITTGTEIGTGLIEVVALTGTGAETLNNVLSATEGQIRIFWVISGSVTFAHNNSKLDNNGGLDFAGATGDIIAYVNKNGDGGTTDGYWHELFRTVRS